MRWLLGVAMLVLLAGCVAEPPSEPTSSGPRLQSVGDANPAPTASPGPTPDGNATSPPASEANATGPTPTADVGAIAAPLRLQGSFELAETGVATPTSRSGLGGANCLLFVQHIHILEGNASITWDPGAVPFAMELFLFHEGTVAALATGEGEIALPLKDIRIGGETFEYLVWQIANDETVAAVDVTGKLDLEFTYLAEATAALEEGHSCAIGHP